MSGTDMMKAVVCYGPGDFRVELRPVPVPGAGEVVIRTGAVGICGSDVRRFNGAEFFWGSEGRPGYLEAPVTLGHEFAGIVERLGPGAAEKHNVTIGDNVVAEQILPCGECRYCVHGDTWMCERHDIFSSKGGRAEGGMSELALLPAHSVVHRIGRGVSALESAYIEPLACAIHAVERADISPGDTVVIAGIGSIGLCMLQWARQSRPGRLIAVGTRPDRLVLAAELGADVTINAREQDPVEAVRALTGGYGADVVIEATGSASAPNQALEMVRKLGTVVAFSLIEGTAIIDWNLIGDQKELTVRGSHLAAACYPVAISALEDGRVRTAPMITATFDIDDFPAAMAEASSGRGIKTMVLPNGPTQST